AKNCIVLCGCKFASERFKKSIGFEIPLDLALERLEHTRHSNQRRDAFALDCGDDFSWVERVLKQHCRAQQWRDPHSHELTEDVAQRHKIEKAKGMKEALPLKVWLHTRFERLQIREDVAVGNNHTLGIGCRPRREDNLRDRSTVERRARVLLGRMPRDGLP